MGVDDLVPGYNPFIGDVPIESKGKPFPVPKTGQPKPLTTSEIQKIKTDLSEIARGELFDPPITLADYCLLAKEIWKEDEQDQKKGCCRI